MIHHHQNDNLTRDPHAAMLARCELIEAQIHTLRADIRLARWRLMLLQTRAALVSLFDALQHRGA